MAERPDAGRLLRRKWDSPDDLARELYVMLSPARQLGQAIGNNPLVLAAHEQARRQPARQGPRLLSGSPRLLKAQAQVRAAANNAATTLFARNVPVIAAAQALAQAVTRSLGPPPDVKVSLPASSPLLPLVRRRLPSPQASSAASIVRQFSQTTGRPRPPERRLADTGGPAPLSRPDRTAGQPGSEPVVLPEQPRGGLLSVPPSAPPADDRVSTPAAAGLAYRTDIARQFAPPSNQFLDTRGIRTDQAFTTDAGVNEPYSRHRVFDDGEYQRRLTRLQLHSFGRVLMQVGINGIPGMQPQSLGGDSLPATPGMGEGMLLDFDGSTMDFYSDQTQQDIYNISLLPVSGGSIAICYLYGEFWIVEPVVFCHGVISQDISAAGDDSIGTGMATPWYVQEDGFVTEGSPDVTVENWYSIVGSTGTSCGLMACDAAVSLEVLDCQTS